MLTPYVWDMLLCILLLAEGLYVIVKTQNFKKAKQVTQDLGGPTRMELHISRA